ncbi:hypothetical protein [Corynebacterium occultum]|nr:hypothetical protein [Corynebacterium occultum]
MMTTVFDLPVEQAIYVGSLGCEHPTLPAPRGATWPPTTTDGRQQLHLHRIDIVQ